MTHDGSSWMYQCYGKSNYNTYVIFTHHNYYINENYHKCTRAIKYHEQRLVKKEWVEKYVLDWKSKQESILNGCKVFDKEKGEYSVMTASQAFGVDKQHLYYLVREGRIPCTRKGSYVVFHHDELVRYFEQQRNLQKGA